MKDIEKKKIELKEYIENNPDDYYGYEKLAALCETVEEKKAVWREFIAKNPNNIFLGYYNLVEVCENLVEICENLVEICEIAEEMKKVWREREILLSKRSDTNV